MWSAVRGKPGRVRPDRLIGSRTIVARAMSLYGREHGGVHRLESERPSRDTNLSNEMFQVGQWALTSQAARQ
jgi:hypothetical protein